MSQEDNIPDDVAIIIGLLIKLVTDTVVYINFVKVLSFFIEKKK